MPITTIKTRTTASRRCPANALARAPQVLDATVALTGGATAADPAGPTLEEPEEFLAVVAAQAVAQALAAETVGAGAAQVATQAIWAIAASRLCPATTLARNSGLQAPPAIARARTVGRSQSAAIAWTSASATGWVTSLTRSRASAQIGGQKPVNPIR